MNASADPNQAIRILGLAFLGGILLQTAVGLILGSLLEEPVLERGPGRTVVAALLVVGAANILVSRFVVLPMQAKSDAPLASMASLAYAFADAPAVYGLVAAILVAEGLVAIPFGLLALLGWFVVRQFLTRLSAPSADDFPKL